MSLYFTLSLSCERLLLIFLRRHHYARTQDNQKSGQVIKIYCMRQYCEIETCNLPGSRPGRCGRCSGHETADSAGGVRTWHWGLLAGDWGSHWKSTGPTGDWGLHHFSIAHWTLVGSGLMEKVFIHLGCGHLTHNYNNTNANHKNKLINEMK